MDILNNKQCLKILHQEKVPIHVIRHCVKVSQVGSKIAYNLLLKGQKIDVDLVRAGALLHDVSKMKAMKLGEDHAELGARLLESMGQPRIAEIIRQHVFLSQPLEKATGVSEEIVVNYADKRVMHTMVVNLDDRFADLLVRYGKNDRAVERIGLLHQQTKLMEKMIFSILGTSPEDIGVVSLGSNS